MHEPPREQRERPDRKKRLSVYLGAELMRLLADFADRREQSRSLIAEAAKRLDRIDRNIQRLERDIGIANEAFAIFMRSWLTSTATMPEAVQAASQAKGGERYDRFLEALGRRLAKGPNLRQEIPDDL